MRRRLLPYLTITVAALTWAAASAAAAEKPLAGTIVSENSVDCGTEAHGHKGKEKMDLVCQEYVVHTTATEYHRRQTKQHDQGLLPLNSNIEFVLDKDKMKFKLNGKKYEFIVVSEASAETKQH
jgi:hypothetical protein